MLGIGKEKREPLKLWNSTLDDNFFDQFKSDLKKIYSVNFKVKTIEQSGNKSQTQVYAYRDRPDNGNSGTYGTLSFIITPLMSNCGAVVVSNVNVNVYIKGGKYNEGIKAIDTCITRCMEFLSRTALYYTLTEHQTQLREALEKCGWIKFGKRWRNANSDNDIITLLKLR